MPTIVQLGRPKMPKIQWEQKCTCDMCESCYVVTQRDLTLVGTDALFVKCPVCKECEQIVKMFGKKTELEIKLCKYARTLEAQRRIRRHKKSLKRTATE